MRSSPNNLQRRQGYGAVTNGLSQAGDALSGSAGGATSSLSQTQIIGVVVGIIVLAVLAIASTWYCCVRSARRRTQRKEQEKEETRQNQARPLHYGDTVTIGMPEMAASAPIPSPNAGEQSRYYGSRRGSDPDDDYWQHKPLAPVDSRNGGGAGYVVDFDELGNPRYHQSQQYLPGYRAPQYQSTPAAHERQPMYIRR